MLVDAVRRFMTAHAIGPCRIVAAVSGGADSLALLLALAELRHDGYEVTCAHVNHHLRGAESDADESYVRGLCQEELDIPLWIANGTVPADLIRSHGVEGAAREVRTQRLQEIRHAIGARFIATAHQRNDQAETVLMRLFTGSGPAGLRGIHRVRDDGFIRPLLDVTRAQIEKFLMTRGVKARTDSMNADPRFLRNRMRALIRDLGPDSVEHFAAMAEEACEEWETLELLLDSIEGVETTESRTTFAALPEDPWLRRALLHRHIRRLSAHARGVSSSDLIRLASQAESTTRVSVTRDVEMLSRDGVVVLRRVPPAAHAFEHPLHAGECLAIGEAGLALRVGAAPRVPAGSLPSGSSQLFQLPAGAAPDFSVRNRRAGDRFQPLGLGGRKKLKDFLIDRKVPLEERDRIPLLLWHDEIVWVGGIEVAEPFKVCGTPGDAYLAELMPIRA